MRSSMPVDNLSLALALLPPQFLNTLYMVFISGFFATCLGLPLGILLSITAKNHIWEKPKWHNALSLIVNIGRSFPFAIFIILLIPLTRLIVGTSLGTSASIVPLSLAATPFLARLVESALKEIDLALIQTAQVMGARRLQIVIKVLLPEALPSLIHAITATLINLVGYSAMAGLVGGGGLGQVAIDYGYHRFNTFIMVVTVIALIIIVQMIQWLGSCLVRSINKRRGLIS